MVLQMRDLKRLAVISGTAGAGAALAALAVFFGVAGYRAEQAQRWNKTAITAKLSHVATERCYRGDCILFFFDLHNSSKVDYWPSIGRKEFIVFDGDSGQYTTPPLGGDYVTFADPVFIAGGQTARVRLRTTIFTAPNAPSSLATTDRSSAILEDLHRRYPKLSGFRILDFNTRYRIDLEMPAPKK